jgi:hypothetical protein
VQITFSAKCPGTWQFIDDKVTVSNTCRLFELIGPKSGSVAPNPATMAFCGDRKGRKFSRKIGEIIPWNAPADGTISAV